VFGAAETQCCVSF